MTNRRIFEAPALDDLEMGVIARISAMKDSLSYVLQDPVRWTGLLARNALAKAIRGSNSIEGYNVTQDEAIAAIEGEEPMDERTEAWIAVDGYRQAMTYVLQLGKDPHFTYSNELLKSLHFMMLSHDLSKWPGRWRAGSISVIDEESKKVVYTGPDESLVDGLMQELMESIRRDAHEGEAPHIVSAAMAHLNLVMIHPFRDGNGRMGRCLQTLILVRSGVQAPQFCSIEEYLGRNRREYYDVLAHVGQGHWNPDEDCRIWVRFCLTAHFRQMLTILRRTKELQKLWDELEAIAADFGLPGRMLFALADASWSLRVRNPMYRKNAEVTPAVASRDLSKLAELGLLIPKGEKRGRYYVAGEKLQEVRRRTREPNRTDEDPFAPDSQMRKPGI
ncbi:MAG: Fic family protein [Candidatus Eisenbacteria bacterium]|nr:Fic family protein [Candidatus Eisenbacteria bacterium]